MKIVTRKSPKQDKQDLIAALLEFLVLSWLNVFFFSSGNSFSLSPICLFLVLYLFLFSFFWFCSCYRSCNVYFSFLYVCLWNRFEVLIYSVFLCLILFLFFAFISLKSYELFVSIFFSFLFPSSCLSMWSHFIVFRYSFFYYRVVLLLLPLPF